MHCMCRAVLLIAFQGGTKPLLTKFTVNADEVKREHSVLAKLWMEPAAPGIVGPVQLLTFGRGSVVCSPTGKRAVQCTV